MKQSWQSNLLDYEQIVEHHQRSGSYISAVNTYEAMMCVISAGRGSLKLLSLYLQNAQKVFKIYLRVNAKLSALRTFSRSLLSEALSPSSARRFLVSQSLSFNLAWLRFSASVLPVPRLNPLQALIWYLDLRILALTDDLPTTSSLLKSSRASATLCRLTMSSLWALSQSALRSRHLRCSDLMSSNKFRNGAIFWSEDLFWNGDIMNGEAQPEQDNMQMWNWKAVSKFKIQVCSISMILRLKERALYIYDLSDRRR